MISRLKVAVSLFGLLTFVFNFAPDVFAQLNPSITTTTITPGVVGTAYSFTVSGTGGQTPYTWSATGLPPGSPAFSINSSTGVITGTPTTAGSFTTTITLRDLTNRSAQKSFTFTIYTPLSVTTQSLPSGTVDVDYPNTNLTATGGATPYTWKLISGTLPDGLSLSGGGRIDGKPKNSATGTFNFTVQVADNGVQTASKALSITISPPLAIDTASPLPSGAIGIPYSQSLAASGGLPPYTWSLSSGTLPAGLTLSAAGVISGTPTGAGVSNFVIQVADTVSKPVTKGFSLTIIPPLSITTSSPLPNGTVGTAYSQSLTATGGAPPYLWSVTGAPSWLTLSAAGVISGTPTTAGTVNFTVQVRDNASQMTTKSFALTVDPPPLAITTESPLPNGTVGTAYSQSLAATGGTPSYTWSVTGAPTWLTLSSAGVISGTPTTAGTANFTVQVRDNASRTATKSFALTVDPPALSITTTSLPSGSVGGAYSQTLTATGGTTPYTWSRASGALPDGLALSTSGVINGTPTAAGVFAFTIRVTGSGSQQTATQAFNLTIINPTFSLASVPDTMQPTQQVVVGLSVSTPQPNPISGSLNLSFTSTSVVPIDDQAVMFSNGSRTVTFTIPANGTTAVFPTTILLLTGTVSGTVIVKASIQGGATDVPIKTVTIPVTTPKLTNVSAARISGGLRVQVTGYSPERRVNNVDFAFDVKTSSGNQRVTLSRNVQPEFDTWYRSGASSAFGSSFTLEQMFTVQGDTSGITAVTVTLTNAQGSGSSPATTFN
jgi:Putative Ig domain